MNLQNQVVKNICGFYASESHLATMLLPYLSKKIKNGENITTILEVGIEENIKELLKNININPKNKEEILKINWNCRQNEIIESIEEQLNECMRNNKEINIIINGTKEKIQENDEIIHKWINQNKNIINNRKINIISLYEIKEFKNANEILERNDLVLNTSGEHKIEEVFIGFKKNKEMEA